MSILTLTLLTVAVGTFSGLGLHKAIKGAENPWYAQRATVFLLFAVLAAVGNMPLWEVTLHNIQPSLFVLSMLVGFIVLPFRRFLASLSPAYSS